jgi:SM-20-related protein
MHNETVFVPNLNDTEIASPISLASNFDIDLICDQLEKVGYAHFKNFISDYTVEMLLDEIKQYNENRDLKIAGVGRDEDHLVKESIRSDKILWVDGKSDAQQKFMDKLEELRLKINYHLMLGLFSSESHFAVYRKGDYYKRHYDSFKGERNRILSMVLYLNAEWQEYDGGLLNLYENEKAIQPFLRIIPKWGEAVIFLSENIPHEVTITNKTRYSIASWFRCNNNNPLTI